MTKQVKHQRTSKLGRPFPAESRIERTPIRVNHKIIEGKYGEFENEQEFNLFKDYIEDTVRTDAYNSILDKVKNNPEDYVDDNALGEAETNFGADEIQGMESMEHLKRNLKPYEDINNLSVSDYAKLYKGIRATDIRMGKRFPIKTLIPKVHKEKTKTPFGEVESYKED